MPRRRYRLFTVCALVIVFMLYRVAQNSWDDAPGYSNLRPPPQSRPPIEDAEQAVDAPPVEAPPSEAQVPVGQDTTIADKEKTPVPPKEADDAKDGVVVPPLKNGDAERPDYNVKEDKVETGDDGAEAAIAVDKSKPAAVSENPVVGDSIVSTNPPKGEGSQAHKSDDSRPLEVHWSRVPENFPVDRLRTLPSGKPKKIPKVQFQFGRESETAKVTRTQRQKRVKSEMERAWAGYKKYAWMHDELSPVSAKYRDPFCGWAATLVDSLDTLWIADMKPEFDEAAKAVQDIDFTYTPRLDIPVFETTIRYLGGLLSAYDVSGGKEGDYPMLLEKAVELGEILLGVFDTPNRMPKLYYKWKPDYASQPHRAGRVGIAELASLSMEFTRLAQVTGENKYYDGIDRITDALVELQERGTAVPGLFPENLDASGCNKTATTIRDNLSKEAKKQMDSDELRQKPEGYGAAVEGDAAPVDKGPIDKGPADKAPVDKGSAKTGNVPPVNPDDRIQRRDVPPEKAEETSTAKKEEMPPHPQPPVPPFGSDGSTAKWDCVEQGLTPGLHAYQQYSMGGSQDSAYEYFPKEYLLLGGLEQKYQKLHEDAVNAIDKWLLYRPMTNDKWDVLFTAKLGTTGDPYHDLTAMYEITHLTCFIGGMYALGGKIFGRDKDIETAKQLTDGCVWAYQLTPSGVMPDGSQVLPCPTLEKCDFNETLWWDTLDGAREWREQELVRWEMQEQEAAKAKAESQLTAPGGELRQDGSSADAKSPPDGEQSSKSNAAGTGDGADLVPGKKATGGSQLPESLRQKLSATSGEDGTVEKQSESGSAEKKSEANVRRSPPVMLPPTKIEKPMSHEQYVKQKIETERIPPGFIGISSAGYILRPEAIESVWYMYRITGDTTWMDKGWAMFEATVRATRTEFANSAIANVMQEEPELRDEMESFWLAETLKYYYLLFSEPDLISLDEWVLNTEAHPFKRPV